MPPPDTHHQKVFISYSHDSPEHSDRVRELSNRLRADGIDCNIDQYETSPPEGWPLWMEKQIRDASFVLMVCTETYHRRVMKEEEPGKGLGVTWEGHITYQNLYIDGAVNKKFVPIFFNSIEVKHIPQPLQGTTYYLVDSESGYDGLYRQLTKQPLHRKPELGEVRELRDAPKLQPLEPKERKHDFFATTWLTNLPFDRNPFFTGREKILTELHAAFSNNTAATKTQAISGLGGLGKSQIAIEYAYRHRADYNTVFWVRADSQLALSTGFGEIARLLNLPEKDAQNPDDIVRAVNHWLENNSGWLLIFDNADEPEMVKEFRPRNANGHFLLTSRAQVFDVLGIVKPIEIDVMLPDEAVKFLFTRTAREMDNEVEISAATQLAEELGCLPLALEQAGAYINAKKARFQDYLAGYRNRRLELLKESRPITGDYPESVATTWSMNFQEVEDASEAASHLLCASAFLSPDRIPLELISNGKSELGPALSEALADVDDDPLVLNEVLEPLTRYSFIRLDADSQTYNIHRLVQEVLQDGLSYDSKRLWVERVVCSLDRTFPDPEFDNWRRCDRLLPHVQIAVKLIESWNVEIEDGAELLNKLGVYCYQRGQYSQAEPTIKRALAMSEKLFGLVDANAATMLNNLASLYSAQGRYAEAKPLHERSLKIRQEVFGPEDTRVAVSLHNLAELYRRTGKYTEAESLQKQSLVCFEKLLGPEDTLVARALNNLAGIYRVQEKYAEAEPLYQRTLHIFEKMFGSTHPDVATALNNLAGLYRLQGRNPEAEPLYRRSLEISRIVLDPDHPDLAISLNNLATFYRDQGKDRQAEPLYRQSLAIFERALGPNHPNVATVLENLAILLRETGPNDESTQLEARAAAIRAEYK